MMFSIFKTMSKTLTYEQMMALFAKADERFAKGEKEMAGFRKSMAERDARADERLTRMEASIARLEVIAEKTNARVDEVVAELRENTTKLDKAIVKLDENNHKVGKLTNKLGGLIEKAVLPDIVAKFKEKGFKFNDVSERVEILNEEENGNLTELDALLENGKYVIAVEAKTEMKIKDVNDHVKRLDALRGLPRFKGKKIYGALATAIARKKPVNYALEQGFYVLQRPDVMGVKILDFPKGHCAKAW
jgi:archaellum component FlaC